MSEKTVTETVTEKTIPPKMLTGSAKEKVNLDRRIGSSARSRSGGSNEGTRERERKRHSHKRRSTSREAERNKSASRLSKRRRDREEKRRHRRRSSSTSSSNDSRPRSSYAGFREIRKKKNRRQEDRSASSSDCTSDRCVGGRSTHNHDSYKFQEPNKTVMVRGLALHHTENDIKTDVQKCGLFPKDVRLIRSRDTGESRGFAFVEFFSIVDATRWMDIKKGVIVFSDQYQANLIYSNSKSVVTKEETDWYCEKCRGHNFRRREYCYKCFFPRKENLGQQDSDSHGGGDPTSTIILGNLDTLTTEADVLQAFQLRNDVARLPIKSVKIAREPVTTISKGICYVEANCISEAVSLFSVLSNGDLIIGGRKVSVAYTKTSNVPSQGSSNVAASALAAAQWTNNASVPSAHNEADPPCVDIKTMEDVQNMAEYYAKLYAKTFDEYSSYIEYYRQYFTQEISQVSPEGRLETVVSNPRLSLMHSLHHSPATAIVNSDSVGSNACVQAVGIKNKRSSADLDCSIDLKSDFNESGKDVSRKPNRRKEPKLESNAKFTDAQRITKKMEKWAKNLNEKKDELMKQTSRSVLAGTSSSASSTDSFNYDVLSVTETGVPNYLEENYVFAMENPNTYKPVVSTTATVENPGSVRSSTDLVVDELCSNNLVDESKLVCLLCKRRFSSKDILQKHVMKSDMHQKNLLELRARHRN